jgi:integrase
MRLDIARREKKIARKGGDTREVKQHWRTLLRILDEKLHPSLVTLELVDAYIEARRSEESRFGGKVRGQTIAREVKALRRGLRLAHGKGWIVDLIEAWPTVDGDEPSAELAGKLHPPHVVRAWLDALPTNVRDEVEFIYFTSLRGGREAKRVRFGHIIRRPGDAVVPALLMLPRLDTKGKRRQKLVPLPPEAMAIIERSPGFGEDKGFVLTQSDHKKTRRKAFVTVAAALEYKAARNITRRDLRAMYATAAELATNDKKAVADLLGHSHTKTTERYLHSDEQRVIAAALAARNSLLAGTAGRDSVELSMVGRGRIELPTNGLKVRFTGAEQCLSPCNHCIQLPAVRAKRRRFSFPAGTVSRDSGVRRRIDVWPRIGGAA